MLGESSRESLTIAQRCMMEFGLLPSSPMFKRLMAADWCEEQGDRVFAEALRANLTVRVHGQASGYGDDVGDGYLCGDGSGDGDGAGNGYGSGDGGGEGSGHGHGMGLGDGDGDGSGRGIDAEYVFRYVYRRRYLNRYGHHRHLTSRNNGEGFGDGSGAGDGDGSGRGAGLEYGRDGYGFGSV